MVVVLVTAYVVVRSVVVNDGLPVVAPANLLVAWIVIVVARWIVIVVIAVVVIIVHWITVVVRRVRLVIV